MNDNHRRSILAFASILSVSGPAMAAGNDFGEGVKLFTKGDFKSAAPVFAREVKSHPMNSDALYFYAASLHRTGKMAEAKAAYEKCARLFPTSQAGMFSNSVLHPVAAPSAYSAPPRSTRQSSSSATQVSADDGSGLPNEARVYFQRDRSGIMVNAEVNNRPIKMLFDTGAEICSFGKNHLRELGIAPPSGPPTSESMGVGTSGTIPCWEMTADIKLGSIMRRGVTISVQEHLTEEPLLGQNFFKDFAYTIDSGASSIHFTRKSGIMRPVAQGFDRSRDTYAVPFTLEGREMIVNAEVNGRVMPMIFDTGASGIAFTPAQLQSLGPSIPDDAEQTSHSGVGGTARGFGFSVQRIKLGPIDKTSVPVHVIENANMPHPLIGQSFFGDWQYTIDNDQHVIRFVRR